MKSAIRQPLLGFSLAVLTAVAMGCSAPELADDRPAQTIAPDSAPPPPAPPAQSYAVEPAAPGPQDDSRLLGGPPEGDGGPAIIASVPVPNPEDLPTDERERIYGPDHHHHAARAWVRRPSARRHHASRPTHFRRGAHVRNPLARHGHHQSASGHGRHPQAAITHGSARPARLHTAPRHPDVAAPHAVASPVTKPPATTPGATQTRLDQLAAALHPDLASGAKLAVPADVAAGKPGVVALTLPATLADRLVAEAGKQGLARDAQTIDFRATLGGAGTSVVPNGAQTARLKSGEAASFNWQVTPIGPNPGPMTAEVGATLKGGAKPETVSLGQVTATSPAARNDASKAATNASRPLQDKPAGASAQTGLFILLGLGLLVVVLFLAMVNRVRRDQRLAERRRKARAFDEARAEAATTPPTPGHSSASETARPATETVEL